MKSSNDLALNKLREAGYLTKKELHANGGKNPRTTTETIRKALRDEDKELLDLLAIRHSDGTIYFPNDFTKKLIERIDSKPGIATWYLLPDFSEVIRQRSSADSKGSKGEASADTTESVSKQSESSSSSVDPSPRPGLPRLPKDPEEAVSVLEDFAERTLDELKRERNRYDDLVPVIKDLPSLLESLQQTIKNAQYVGLSEQDKDRIDRFLGAATDVQSSVPSTNNGQDRSTQPRPANESVGPDVNESLVDEVIDVSPDDTKIEVDSRKSEQEGDELEKDKKAQKQSQSKKKKGKPAKSTVQKSSAQSTAVSKKKTNKKSVSDQKLAKKAKASAKKDLFPTVTAIKNFFSGDNE